MYLTKYTAQKLTVFALGGLAMALAGCGGGSTNGNIDGLTTQTSDPYIYAYADNFGAAASGFASGTPATSTSAAIPASPGEPASTDMFDFTFASANSAPNSTLSGAGPFELGLAPGASTTFAPGSVLPAVPTGSTTLFFRAQAAQGQEGNNLENITAASLTVPGQSPANFTVSPGFTEASAAGPFKASPYITAPLNLSSITTSGVYPFVASITDAGNRTTTTTFQVVVLAPGYAAIASASTLALTLGHASYTYGPDANGTTVLIFPAGTAHVSVASGTTQLVPTTAGTVTVL